MTQLTQEEIRDEVLSVFEDNEQGFVQFSEDVDQIEKSSIDFFERKAISIKNALINDENVKEEDLESMYISSIEKLKEQVLSDAKEKVANLTKSLS